MMLAVGDRLPGAPPPIGFNSASATRPESRHVESKELPDE